MKKWLSALALTSALVVGLAACGSNNGSKDEKKIVVGASNTPHAEILEQAKPIL
jgi:D-methionine transport system substrate-binding protein